MEKRGKNKKGLSNFTATILLIGFVIAIILIVVLWGKNYLEERSKKEGELAKKQLECGNVKMKVGEITDNFIEVRNDGSVPIDGFIRRGLEGGADVARLGAKTDILEKFSIPTEGLQGDIEIIPSLRPDGCFNPYCYVPCSEKSKIIKMS